MLAHTCTDTHWQITIIPDSMTTIFSHQWLLTATALAIHFHLQQVCLRDNTPFLYENLNQVTQALNCCNAAILQCS